MRKLVGVVMAVGLLASLSACASTPGTFSSCESGENASLVTAKGDFGKDPEAKFPTPLVSKKPEVSVLSPGDGDAVAADGGVNLTLSFYDGKTGDPVPTQNGPITALTARMLVNGGLLPFIEAAKCATVGSRFVATGTSVQVLGPDNGLDDDTTVVVVADIDSAFLGKANGADQVPQAGYPSVVLAPNGRPGLTFAAANAPDGLGAIALKQGNGATVKKGDPVIANITGIVWGKKTTFLSSWDQKVPATVVAADIADDASGLAKAVIGQKVGSQLLVVVAPGQGYPSGKEPAGVTAGDTLVFVFDILGISQ